MIVCPNCNHQNPDGAVQCEACYTPLPALATCPSCGASVQSDASFCGQCGFDLRTATTAPPSTTTTNAVSPDDIESTSPGIEEDEMDIPDLISPDPLIPPAPLSTEAFQESSSAPSPESQSSSIPKGIPAPFEEATAAILPPPNASTPGSVGTTQLQVNRARLLHVQTNTGLELASQLPIIHIGKPNDRIPPTLDVSGFPNSEIVSRVHATIRVEGDVYYIEDVGSSNGTYINNMPLPPGNRHRLRAGDRIALGKGDKVTFIFQNG